MENHEAPIDVLIYPIVYCYRHAVELSIKHLARELPKLYSGADAVRAGHKLDDMWKDVAGYLARDAAFDPENTLVRTVDKVLTELMEFDPMGFTFRYPESLKGDPHLQDSWLINIYVLRDAMQPVREAFKYWDFTARAIEESRSPTVCDQLEMGILVHGAVARQVADFWRYLVNVGVFVDAST